jgi:ribosome-interacting GTPase 1
MSSNIGLIAQRAYDKYLEANTLEDRIKRLEEFLSVVPKHKATERIVALNRKRLAKLKRELVEETERHKAQVGGPKSAFSIKKEDTAQICLVSAFLSPGAGKSALLEALTGASTGGIGTFTPEPVVGTYEWKQIHFQMLDMPAIMKDASSGAGNGLKIFPLLRSTDLIALCIDLSQDPQIQWDLLMGEFDAARIRINVNPPPISIERTGSGGVQVRFLSPEAKNSGIPLEKIEETVRHNGYQHAILKIWGKFTLNDVEGALNTGLSWRQAVIIATKGDDLHAKPNFERLKQLASDRFQVLPTAIIDGVPQKLENLGEVVLKELDCIKIYTRKGKDVAQKPLILKKGATVGDVAKKIHKIFYETFKFANVFREGSKIPKIKAGLNFIVEDNDVVEIFSTA